MGNYNFEDNNYEFDKTVRLDDISEKVKQIEGLEETAEFEPVVNKAKRPPAPRKKTSGGANSVDSLLSDKMVRLSIIGGLVVFAFMFLMMFVFVFDKPSKSADPAINNDNQVDITDMVSSNDEPIEAIVMSTESGRILNLYVPEQKSNTRVTLTGDTVLLGATGAKIAVGEYLEGDIVTVTLDEKGEAKQISIPSDIWKTESVTGITLDNDKKGLFFGDNVYKYSGETLAFFDGKPMYLTDVSPADTVTVYGRGSDVISLRVETGHGLVVFRNLNLLEEPEILIDDKVIEIDEKNGSAEIGLGVKKLTIRGSNLDNEYITVITVDGNESLSIDLSEVIEETQRGKIILNVDQSGYAVFVDGESYTESLTEILVEKGSHKIEITKQGYENWSTSITVGDSPQTLKVTMKAVSSSGGGTQTQESTGSLSISTVPGWAKIYVDGNYIGVSPVMTTLTYGQHTVEADLDGYDTYSERVNINGPEKTITLNLD